MERFYVECQDCCTSWSTSDHFRADGLADNHEEETGHKVKITWVTKVPTEETIEY